MKIMTHELPETHWPKMARKNGIRYGTYHRRVTVYGWSKEKAATTPLKHKGSRTIDPESTAQKLKRHGLCKATVWKYRKRNPGTELSDDEIIEQALAKREEPTLAEQARAKGLDRSTVSRRMTRLGWSLEKALNTPVIEPREARKMRKTRGWAS